MKDYRAAHGSTERTWRTKGGGKGISNVESSGEADEGGRKEVAAVETRRSWSSQYNKHDLCNVETKNRFEMLWEDDEEGHGESEMELPKNVVQCAARGEANAVQSERKRDATVDNGTSEINSVQSKQMLNVTIDSGASESVTNRNTAPQYKIERPAGPERDTQYIMANGEVTNNFGEKRIPVYTNEGESCLLRMQVTDVRKSLLSVGKVCDAGHTVTFTREGGYMEHVKSGSRTHFQRTGGTYSLSLEIAEQADFIGQGC